MFNRAALSLALLASSVGIALPQSTPLTCATGAVNPAVRAEGITEILGDILLNCTGGAPNSTVTLNLAVYLNIGITNRISTAGITDVSLTVDTGSGPAPASAPGVLQSSNTVSFNGVTVTIPAKGGVSLRISNLRGNVTQIGAGAQRPVQAALSISGVPSTVLANSSPLSVGIPAQGLLASYATTGIRCVGSPLPSTTISLSSLFAAGTRFVSTRVTEGYPTAFEPKARTGDTGIRFIAQYSGMPVGARLFVPDVVAGSDAAQPTAAGDLGGTPSGGAYTPGSGTLLLARVTGTDANGAGGTLVYTPGAPGSGTVTFDAANEVKLTNGAGVAVYEVLDANPNVRESAQFPTFIGLPPITDGSTPVATEQISLAPISTVYTATTTDPVPRFLNVAPPSDCPALADCNANYFPALSVNASQPLQFTAIAGSALQTKTVQVNNKGGGAMSWTATIGFATGPNWLTVNPNAGVNGGTVLVNVWPQNVGPGTYTGTLIIDAGPQAGSQTLPVTLTVTALPPATTLPNPTPTPTPAPTPTGPATPTVIIQSLANAARTDSAVVSPGSLAVIKGLHLKGAVVSVTFDSLPATILSGDDSSISVQLPPTLAPDHTSQLQVTVDGVKSATFPISIAELAPAIFANGVLNQDSSVNNEANPAAVGSVLQIFSTGLLTVPPGPVMVKLHDRQLTPAYAAAAPGLIGVIQVNVAIPTDLPAMTTQLAVCSYGLNDSNDPVCSQPVNVTLQQAPQQ